jgi:hypothetical protein
MVLCTGSQPFEGTDVEQLDYWLAKPFSEAP